MMLCKRLARWESEDGIQWVNLWKQVERGTCCYLLAYANGGSHFLRDSDAEALAEAEAMIGANQYLPGIAKRPLRRTDANLTP